MGMHGSPPYSSGFTMDSPAEFSGGVTVSGGLAAPNTKGLVYFVDGTAGLDTYDGLTWTKAKKTIQAAVTAAGAYGVVYVIPKEMTAGTTDPGSYAESIIIPATHECLSIIGIGNRTQGGLPQLKVGTTTTSAILTIRSAGCTIANLGINGSGATGGGILLDDDGSTKSAFGTTIANCHFKNCKGTDATGAETGGAIQWSATGGAWQVRIVDNIFYKNVGDVVLMGTSAAVPQDVVIEGNTFMGTAATVDCHLYLAGGSGMASVSVINNTFAAVLPALSGGNNTRYADLTGCTGTFSGNTFAGSYTTTGFGAAKAAAKLPTTVGIAHNYSDAGLIVREA